MPEAKIKEDKSEYLKQKINFFLVNYFHWLKIGLFLIILLSGLFFIVKPKYSSTIVGVEQSKDKNQERYDMLQGQLGQLNRLNEAYKKINFNNVDKLNAMLIGGQHYEDLFSQIELMIQRRGLFLQSVEIDSGEEEESIGQSRISKAQEEINIAQRKLPKGIVKVDFNINIIGVDYVNLKGLLHDFENNVQLFDIVNLNFSPQDQSASFKINTYYLEDVE